MKTFRWLLAALLLLPAAGSRADGLWNWAAHRYGLEADTRQSLPLHDELLMPYWDAWLLRPADSPIAGPQAVVPAATPSAAPSALPVLSARAWLYISKAQQRLYLKDGERTILSWPVSTARYSLSTPVGRFRVIEQVANPPYYGRHGSYKPHDPRNPLGTRWIGLNVGHFRTGVPIGIHGTIEPDKIGTAASDGCIRLRNTDVELLFRLVKTGMPVVISDQ